MAEGRLTVEVDASLADIVPRYLNRRGEDVAAIRRSLAECDLESARVLGHSMKGSGAGYGFDRVTELGALIESAAASGDGDAVRDAADRLESYLASVDVTYVDEEA